MSKPIILFLFPLLLIHSFNDTKAQELTYTIDLHGNEIGKITAFVTETPQSHTYTVLSEVNFKVFWKKYNRVSNNYVVYKNDNLVESYAGVYMNDDLEDSVIMMHDGNVYNCYRFQDEISSVIDQYVNFTSIELYFSEPLGVREIYSEQHLTYCPLENFENHKYKLFLPNGNINTYTYENQKLVEVIIDRSWFNLRFTRSN